MPVGKPGFGKPESDYPKKRLYLLRRGWGKVTNLGLALIPVASDRSRIRDAVALLEKSIGPFSFALYKQRDAIPHLSLMQGVFENDEEALSALEDVDFSRVRSSLDVSQLHLWARKIIFLNLEPVDWLTQLHENIVNAWLPLVAKEPADPQDFDGISEGQRHSYEKTGYPFALGEFIPHITLAHLDKPISDAEEFARELEELRRFRIQQYVRFEKVAIFRVEPLGVCREIVDEWEI